MINLLKKTVSLFAMLSASFSVMAQNNQPIEMADGLYQSGKIYVVILVGVIIFAGIATYLILLDRKITRLEKEINKDSAI